MQDRVHLRSDWCPKEGRLTGGPRTDGTCGLCGASIETRTDGAGTGDAIQPQPVEGFRDGNSPQLKAAGRLRWPFIIMQVLLVIQILLSMLKIWVAAVWAGWDFEAALGLAVIENYSALAFAASAITFVVWSFLAHSNLDEFGRLDQTHSHRATIWWWLAPLANFVMPYRVIYETVRGSDAPQGDPSWKQTPLPRSVAWWTGLFVTGLLLNQGVLVLFEDALWADDFGLLRAMTLVTELVWIAAAVLAIMMMARVNRSQRLLATRWKGQTPYRFGGPAKDRQPSSFLGPIDTAIDDDSGSSII